MSNIKDIEIKENLTEKIIILKLSIPFPLNTYNPLKSIIKDFCNKNHFGLKKLIITKRVILIAGYPVSGQKVQEENPLK